MTGAGWFIVRSLIACAICFPLIVLILATDS